MTWKDDAQALDATLAALYGDLLDYPLLDSTPFPLDPALAPASAEPAQPILSPSEALSAYAAKIRYCQDCSLHIGRKNLVFGRGAPTAPLAFVGDVPSLEDDAAGLPFADEAGSLLDKMIVAMKLQPETTYLTNLFKCRPPGSQRVDEELFRACEVHLKEQFSHLGASIIVALGETASRILARSQAPLRVLRGQEFEWEGHRVICTHHPRDLQSAPALKKEAWSDLQVVMRMMGIIR